MNNDKIVKIANDDNKDDTVVINNKKSRKKLILVIVIVLPIIVAVGLYIYYINKVYKSYKVISKYDFTESTEMCYERYQDSFVKYSKDGISYINNQGKEIWTQAYALKDPSVKVCGEYIVAADINGNDIYVFSKSGLVQDIKTSYPICNVEVASQGVVAAVLEAEEENYIMLYDKNGDTLVEKKTTINKDGYPFDVDISNDGEKMIVSYITVDGLSTVCSLSFYNFGSVGQNENADRLVGAETISDGMVPDVKFLSNDIVCAFADNKIIIYSMKDKPSKKCEIQYDGEVSSVISGEKYVGVVYKNETANGIVNQLKVYNLNGKLKYTKEFTFNYTDIQTTNKNIIIYGQNECLIYDLSGREKFNYTFNTNIKKIVPGGKRYQYIIIDENSARLIKLK